MEVDLKQLTTKEAEDIKKICSKASKRPRKKTFTLRWLYDYLDESFKDFSYESFDDTLDMMDSLFDLGLIVKVRSQKLRSDIRWHLEEEGFIGELSKENKKRYMKLMTKWKINPKGIKNTEDEEDDEDDD